MQPCDEQGLIDADDHPERPVHAYGNHSRTEDIPP
jgi:hypothetical protein